MPCQPATDHPSHPVRPTAKPPAANPPTAASGLSPASTPESPSAPGSATLTAHPTSSAISEMIATAARLAGQPVPIAISLYYNLEWYAARPGQTPHPTTIRLWKDQAEMLIRRYEDLLCHLVEVQVSILDANRQMEADLFAAAEEMLGGTGYTEICNQ